MDVDTDTAWLGLFVLKWLVSSDQRHQAGKAAAIACGCSLDLVGIPPARDGTASPESYDAAGIGPPATSVSAVPLDLRRRLSNPSLMSFRSVALDVHTRHCQVAVYLLGQRITALAKGRAVLR